MPLRSIPPNAKPCIYALSWRDPLLIQTLRLVSLCWVFGLKKKQTKQKTKQTKTKNKQTKNMNRTFMWNIMSKYANKRLFMLSSLERFEFSKSELVTVCKGYIRPLLEYSYVIFYSSLTPSQAHQLERVQKRALRIVLGLNLFSH